MIVVDVETTGNEGAKHSLVSIGAVDFNNPQNQFYGECRIWKGAEIMQQALDVNGFSVHEITRANKLSEKELVSSFLEWVESCQNKTIAGLNPALDTDFLKSAAKRAGLEWNFSYRLVDLHSVCYASHLMNNKKIPLKNGCSHFTGDAILTSVGLPPEPRPHNGLTGAKMEAEAFSRLLFKRGLFKEYANFPIVHLLAGGELASGNPNDQK